MGAVASTALGVGSVNTILEDCATLVQLEYVLTCRATVCGAAWPPARTLPAPTSVTSRSMAAGLLDGTVQGHIEEASRFAENAAGNLLRARVKPA